MDSVTQMGESQGHAGLIGSAESPASTLWGKPREPYAVRLARHADLQKIFALRYDVFFSELGATGAGDDAVLDCGMDIDAHDALCDHLVVSKGADIVGTYRMMPLIRLSETAGLVGPQQPYSQSEFCLDAARTHFGDGAILELGRSCIHADHRNGQVARLLWAGLARYMIEGGFQAVIGCVSVHGLSALQAERLGETFRQQGLWDSRFDCPVQDKYRNGPEIDLESSAACHEEARPSEATLPPLLKGYLNLGAKICGGPAYDRSFGCHDFLVLLETSSLPARVVQALLAVARR